MGKRRSGSEAENRPEPSARTIASRENGSRGGKVRAAQNDRVVLQEWSSRGGKKVLEKYGREYFVELRKKRKYYPDDGEPPLVRQPRKVLVARENGSRGGRTRAELYGPEHFREWGRLGGIATRTRHGNEFFREIRKKRRCYRKGYVTLKTKTRLREEALQQAKASPNWAIAELWKAVAEDWKP